jgi:hypothetical protein
MEYGTFKVIQSILVDYYPPVMEKAVLTELLLPK